MIEERSLKIALAVTWALVVLFLLGFGMWVLREYVLVPEHASSLPPIPAAQEPREREVTLYFAGESASKLIPEKRRLKLVSEPTENVAAIMAELVKGPESAALYPTIPEGARVLNSYRLDDTLVLDFTSELRTNHPGGSTGELLTVYSIVNTMTENFQGIEKVKIMIEGNEVESLTGHLDLTGPLRADTRWMSPTGGTAPDSGTARTAGWDRAF